MPNPSGNNGTKSDAVTVDLRVRTVMEWILQGFIVKDILNQGVSKWGVDERTVKNYIKGARKEFREARKGKHDERIDFYLSAKMKLYNELKYKDTPKGAIAADSILNSMAKLEGVLVDKMDLTSKGNEIKPANITHNIVFKKCDGQPEEP